MWHEEKINICKIDLFLQNKLDRQLFIQIFRQVFEKQHKIPLREKCPNTESDKTPHLDTFHAVYLVSRLVSGGGGGGTGGGHFQVH